MTTPKPKLEHTIVVGAGAAGLGVALELSRCGVDALVLDRGDRVGSRWLDRYTGLRLNTVRQLSGFRGHPIPRAAGRWVDRRDFATYLETCARETGVRIDFGVDVRRIERAETAGWSVVTEAGELRCRSVVIATGYDRVPKIPDWPGREGFEGELLHSADYRDAALYAGRDVLVVGPGNTGSEIATQLAHARAGRVRLSVRTPVNLMPGTFLGIPSTWFARMNETGPRRLVDKGALMIQRLAFGDLARYGMGRAPLGVATELHQRGLGPVLDRGFVTALKRGEIGIVGAVTGFEGRLVMLAGDRSIGPDVVIAATGYRPGLEPLVGHLGALDSRGRPIVRDGGGEIDGAPGLYFNGYWLPLSGQLPAMRRSSRRIARTIARNLDAGRGASGLW